MEKIAVLIPCYNEELTVEKVVTDFKRELPAADIYVYDNNSKDKTAALASSAGAIVRKETAQGKGNVVRTMFKDIDADVYILVDGDDTYPAEYGRKMANLVLEKNADMVVGDRLSSTYFNENKRPFHNFGNTLVRASVNRLFHTDIRDIMTGYRAFSFLFVKSFPVLSKGFEIETEMTIHGVEKNMRIENVIIEYRDRPSGSESKLNTYSDGFKVLKTIGRLYKNYRPFGFFGRISTVLMLVSMGLLIPEILHDIQVGKVKHPFIFVSSGILIFTSIVSFFSGAVLSTLVEKERQAYEFRLQMIEKMKSEIE